MSRSRFAPWACVALALGGISTLAADQGPAKDPIKLNDVRERGIEGELGVPLGTVVKVSGRVVANPGNGKADEPDVLEIRTVDGKTLPKPACYPFRPADPWVEVKAPKRGATFAYRGYETGGYAGIPKGYDAKYQAKGYWFETAFCVIASDVR